MNEPQALMSISRNGEAPTPLAPIKGRWYSGISQRGRGAIACYQGWGEFSLGDGTPVDMAVYEHLEEHAPR